MAFSESYLFVLVISLLLAIPLGLAIRTLLHAKERVILPILRLSQTKSLGTSMVKQCSAIGQSFVIDPSALSTHSRRQSW